MIDGVNAPEEESFGAFYFAEKGKGYERIIDFIGKSVEKAAV